MDLVPPVCDACGAPVPLCDGELATCSRCGAQVPIDEAHRSLRRAAEAARARRREAEAALRQLQRRLPRWVPTLYNYVAIPAVVIAVPVGFALTQSEYGWFAREWVVLAGILPFMIMLLPALVMWARGNPGAYINALGVKLRPAPPRPDAVGVECGVCGAPLEVEIDAFAATCDYCGADSWVREQPGGHDHAGDEKREAANLADLMQVESFRAFDINLLLIVYPAVTAIVCGILFYFLPGRAEWDAMQYTRSVDYVWDLVRRPGPVVDLAVVGEDLIAVGQDGRVQICDVRDWKWDELDDSEALLGEVLGVGALGDRALLVGRGGAAAWLEDGELEPVDVGLSVDLHDAWVGADGSAAVVGAEGRSAIFDGEWWWAPAPASGNELLAVWGRSGRELYAAGGISAWVLDGDTWVGDTFWDLPRVLDVSGDEQAVYVATAPLDGESESVWVTIYARRADSWEMMTFYGTTYAAVASAPDGVWAVGPAGFVEREGELPIHAPGTGDLHAVVVWDGRLVVGGDDGVFSRPLEED